MEEIWKNISIPGYEHFMVSNLGRVKNSKTDHIMTIGDNGRGYCNCKIKTGGITKTVYVHRLVAEAFLPDWDPTLQVNHIDKNKKNNCVTNLEMVTDAENKEWSRREYIDGHLKAQGKTILVYDLEGNFIMEYRGLWEFCRKYGHDPRAVQRVISGQQKYHHNLVFKYKEEG